MRVVYVVVLIIFLNACKVDDWINSRDNSYTSENAEKIWASFQFNVPEEDKENPQGFVSYYFLGEVSRPLYKKIKNNQLQTGFISLENVKYWGHDDKIHDYKDGQNTGEIVFRIEDIRRMMLMNTRPVSGKGAEQFDEQEIEGVMSPTINADSTSTDATSTDSASIDSMDTDSTAEDAR